MLAFRSQLERRGFKQTTGILSLNESKTFECLKRRRRFFGSGIDVFTAEVCKKKTESSESHADGPVVIAAKVPFETLLLGSFKSPDRLVPSMMPVTAGKIVAKTLRCRIYSKPSSGEGLAGGVAYIASHLYSVLLACGVAYNSHFDFSSNSYPPFF